MIKQGIILLDFSNALGHITANMKSIDGIFVKSLGNILVTFRKCLVSFRTVIKEYGESLVLRHSFISP